MIAAATVPWTDKTWAGYLIVEQRSGSTFNPATGAWEAVGQPLQPADLNRLMVRPGPPMSFASITPWPFAGFARLWADVGDKIDGDQVVAFWLKLDKQGNFAAPGDLPPVWMDLSPAGLIVYPDGAVMKPAATGPGPSPAVPGSI